MRDKLQDISVDRWLMRIKDVIAIVGSVFAVLYMAYNFFQKIDQINMNMIRLQAEVSLLKADVRNVR